jgi:hypothetical protein
VVEVPRRSWYRRCGVCCWPPNWWGAVVLVAAVLPTSTRARPEPGVLWQQGGRAGSVGGWFAAPGRWRVLWSFNCRSFAGYGGGNFKLSGAGAFAGVSVQRVGSGDGASCGSLVAAGAA